MFHCHRTVQRRKIKSSLFSVQVFNHSIFFLGRLRITILRLTVSCICFWSIKTDEEYLKLFLMLEVPVIKSPYST